MKTAELLNEWLTTYERERVKPRTYARYEGLINLHIVPVLGEVEINELCRRQIQEFLTKKGRRGRKTPERSEKRRLCCRRSRRWRCRCCDRTV